jgi:cytochrome b561
MAIAGKPPVELRHARRIWRTRGSLFNWLFLGSSLLILGVVLLLAHLSKADPDPNNDPFRAFGILAFIMVLLVTAYTLRRRFVRQLPGKVQNWLWLHIWFGIASVLLVGIHENWQNITREFSFAGERFSEAAYGTTALYALILLVLSGVVGRLLDLWQARVIAAEADTNGAGIARAVEERLLELTLTIERLSAGKSTPFKDYCKMALNAEQSPPLSPPALPPNEQADFQRVCAVFEEYARLTGSLQRQRRAHLIIRAWRSIHIPLACVALLVIGYHAIFELTQMLLGQ